MKKVYYNARVYTGELPLQQAFAVEEDRFCFVGTDAEALALDAQEKIDMNGAFVCAGFIDSHMHLLNLGQTLGIAPLAQHTGSLQEMLACLHSTPPGRGGWILGRGWNQDLFADTDRMPDRWDLDRVSIEHPVCVVRACGHALAVNSRALELLGVTAATPQPEGGRIGMKNGEPDGLFFDNAMDRVYAAVPVPGKDELKTMLRQACTVLNAHGITGCGSDDYCVFLELPWQEINRAFLELEAEGGLTVRVQEQANLTTPEALREYIAADESLKNGNLFRAGPLKLLGDGALGARTAYLSRPYADDPQTRGLSVFTPQEFDELIGIAHAAGMQVAVHCIGDGCLDLVLNSLDKAQAAHPRTGCRHGIVHCQITRPDQLERMAKAGLHIYAQSIFLDYDIHIVEQRVGAELAASSYSWKTLLDMGCTVSNGSDCPVEAPEVLAGIQCAVTRRDLKGSGPYLEQEAFTVQQALDSFTKAGAYACFEEERRGRIASGMLADFVVLGADPFAVEPSALHSIPVLETWLGGVQVFAAQS